MNCFSVDLSANYESCTINHASEVRRELNGTHMCPLHQLAVAHKHVSLISTFSLSCECKKAAFVTHAFFPPPPGTPSLSGTGTVTILVDDVNDNVPVFTSSTFHTTIAEDAPTGTDVLLVNSSDADVGVNGVVRCASLRSRLFFPAKLKRGTPGGPRPD